MFLLKKFPIHPFLFAVSFIFYQYNVNRDELSLFVTLSPVFVASVVTALLLFLFRFLLKEFRKAAIIVSIFLILSFSYGGVLSYLSGSALGEILGEGKTFIWCSVIVILLCFLGIKKIQGNLYETTKYLNLVSCLLVFFQSVSIGSYKIKTSGFSAEKSVKMQISNKAVINQSSQTPDIYYIILDGYGRSDILKKYLDCDNSGFISFLEKKGFYVAKKSRSNYRITPYSLSSSFNMDYLRNMKIPTGDGSKDFSPMYELIENNRVMRFLKSLGYRYVHFNSSSTITETNKHADIYINTTGFYREFDEMLINTTMLKGFGFNLFNENNRRRKILLHNFDKLAEMPKIKGAKFVFAHFLMPHWPFLFDQNGNAQPEYKTKPIPQNMESACQFLTFGNKKVVQVLNKILERSATPPVIIIQGDHGMEFVFQGVHPNGLELTEEFGILNAYYLPNGVSEKLYETISPVNSFRLIFDNYFGTDFGLLEDISYFSWYDPIKFISVPDESSLLIAGIKKVSAGDAWKKRLTEAIKKYPDFHEAYANLAYIYHEEKLYAKAIRFFKKSIEIKPDYHTYYLGLGDLYADIERHQEAVETYKEGIKTNPKLWLFYFKLSKANSKLGNYKEALKNMTKATRLKTGI
ncbi:MAG: hypothetical protein CMQ15_17720 [Gammaproteobacteria bacterium]|nr:hypothetical protein [Gammaproteobacteria bacterium]|tara:strand:- start:1127 stop:3031 length:1905 start_codon:yes stop_codon:yes gene_type:complete